MPLLSCAMQGTQQPANNSTGRAESTKVHHLVCLVARCRDGLACMRHRPVCLWFGCSPPSISILSAFSTEVPASSRKLHVRGRPYMLGSVPAAGSQQTSSMREGHIVSRWYCLQGREGTRRATALCFRQD